VAADTHPINGFDAKKQQSRLTLQRATKVVEGEIYILPDFSLKTLPLKSFGWPAQYNYSAKSNRNPKKIVALSRQFLLTLTSHFIKKNCNIKLFFYNIEL
jgi:hypothetical protein